MDCEQLLNKQAAMLVVHSNLPVPGKDVAGGGHRQPVMLELNNEVKNSKDVRSVALSDAVDTASWR